jgi:NADPH2:quinone reductase
VIGKDPARAAQVVSEVLGLLAEKKLRPVIYEPIYEGLEEVGKGLKDLEERKIWGKGVVRIRKERNVKAKL